MAVIAEQKISYRSQLPDHVDGSDAWFKKHLNFKAEYNYITQSLLNGNPPVSIPDAQKMLGRDMLTFVSEWGAGEYKLTVQPAAHYSIRKVGDKIQVYIGDLESFGDHSDKFINLDSFPKSIGIGLKRAFNDMYDGEVGSGIAILSPTELYKEYGSPGDVINPMIVTEIDINETGDKTVKVAGWFLFINRKLSESERMFVHNIHDDLNQDSRDLSIDKFGFGKHVPIGETSADLYVSTPRSFNFIGEINNTDEMIEPYVLRLNHLFNKKFNKDLFPVAQEFEVRQQIRSLIETHASELLTLLINNSEMAFRDLVYLIMHGGQETWAVNNHEDPNQYMADWREGLIQAKGFHSANGENLELFWDPIADDWIGGTAICGVVENDKVCNNLLHRGRKIKRMQSQCIDCIKEKAA